MSNWMKNTRTWLGLGNEAYYDDEYGDPEYDDYVDDYDEPPVERASQARPTSSRPSALAFLHRLGAVAITRPRSRRR